MIGHCLSWCIGCMAFSTSFAATKEWPVAGPGRDGAYPDCPCGHYVGEQSLDVLYPRQVVKQNGVSYVRMLQTKLLVHSGYGSGMCSDWTSSMLYPECDGQPQQPDWCLRKWCYVNQTLCQRRSVKSREFVGLSYSYETCGNLDHYVQPHLRKWNNSQALYAFAFGHEADDNPNAGSIPLNMGLAFAAHVLSRVGIDRQSLRYRKQLSNVTRRAFTSSYTGCVHDVALGNLDMCLGDFWDTAERRSFGSASFVRIAGEQIFLMGPKANTAETMLDMLAKPFAPFNPDVWCMVFAVVLATSVAMLLFEFHRKDGDFVDDSCCHNFCKSLYFAISSFVNAGVAFTSVTLSGRIVAIGYGIFVLICITSFTAETATFLISGALKSTHNSIEDVLGAKLTICYSMGMQKMLEAKHPAMKQFGVPVDAASGSVFGELLTNGTCDYGIIGEQWMDDSWEIGEFCNLQFIGTPILVFPLGYWVSDELRSSLGWAVAVESSAGSWSEVEKKFQKQAMCAKKNRRLSAQSQSAQSVHNIVHIRRLGARDTLNGSKASGPDRLGLKHMMGAFLVPVICYMVASVIRCFELCWLWLHKEDEDVMAEIENGALKTVASPAHQTGPKLGPQWPNLLNARWSETNKIAFVHSSEPQPSPHNETCLPRREVSLEAKQDGMGDDCSYQGNNTTERPISTEFQLHRDEYLSPSCNLTPDEHYFKAEQERLDNWQSSLRAAGRRLAEQQQQFFQEERCRLAKIRDALEEERQALEAERQQAKATSI